MTLYRIDNWPPGQPALHVDAPDGIVLALQRAEESIAKAQADLDDWTYRMRLQRSRAWIAYHDKHGWLDDGHRERSMRDLRDAETVTTSE